MAWDAPGVRKADHMVAPLRYLAKPVSFTRQFVIARAYSGSFPPPNPIVPQTVFKWRWKGSMAPLVHRRDLPFNEHYSRSIGEGGMVCMVYRK